MKRLASIFVLLLCGLPSWATITEVQHKVGAAASGTTIAVTITANTAGNLIVVGVGNVDNLTVTGVADNATGGTNTYTQFTGAHEFDGNLRHSDVWYCLSAAHAGATTVTVTLSGTMTNGGAAFVFEVSGFAAAATDGANIATNGASANPVGASVTTTSTTGFLVGILTDGSQVSANPAAGNEFTSGGDQNNAHGSQGSVSLISSTAAAHNPAWTCASDSWTSSTAAFKEGVNITQTAFRFRNDDGNEASATWLANEDTNVTQPLSTNTRLRMQADTGGASGSQQYQLEWKKSTDSSYRAVAVAPSPVTVTYCASGCTATAGPWVAPVDVSTVQVECVGGGGAGARSTANTTGRAGGGGGGYARRNAMAVTPGSSYTLSLGVGGTGGATPADGTDTTFTGDASVVCTGKGAVSCALNAATGCAGGTGSTGDVTWDGGVGGNGSTSTCAGSGSGSGGGGESGSSNQIGGSASGMTAGTGGDGGDGATGRNTDGVGATGNVPGGGGSGGCRNATSRNGGSGATGKITLTYTPAPAIILYGTTNIAANAVTATTAQLSVPNSHSFTAGLIDDDTTPLPAVTIGSSNYSEFEWNMRAVSPAANGSIYTFRVTMNGTVFTTYSVTPQWTIGTAGAAVPCTITLMGAGSC